MAVVPHPSSLGPRSLFPLAITEATYNQYWDYGAGGPKPNPFFIVTADGFTGNAAGQWTSFATDANNDITTMTTLVANANPQTLSIGGTIFLQDGIPSTLYSRVPLHLPLLLPVVQGAAGKAQLILGFGPIQVDSIRIDPVAGSYIQVHFIKSFVGMGGPGGPNYGAYMPPRLAR
jgi:hypothetical protein